MQVMLPSPAREMLVELTRPEAIRADAGWQASLLCVIATMAVVLPLAWPLSGKPGDTSLIDQQTLWQAVREAFTHPSYLLLTSGFFVCGFHVAFYSVHLPAFVADQGLDAWPKCGSASGLPTAVWSKPGRGVTSIINQIIQLAAPH